MKVFTTVSTYYKNIFGNKTYRIPLSIAQTCPTRDGTLAKSGCLYCDVKGSAADDLALKIPLRQQFELMLKKRRSPNKSGKYLLYFQPYTSSYQKDPLSFLKEIQPLFKLPEVVGMSFSTRPDSMTPPWWALLEDLRSTTYVEVEVGLESASNQTLKRMVRGHTVKDVELFLQKARESEIPAIAHVILGLPGETLRDFQSTASFLASQPLHGVKIHTFHLMASSPLGKILGVKPGENYPGGTSFQLPHGLSFQLFTLEGYGEALRAFLEILPEDRVLYRLTAERWGDDCVGPDWVKDKKRGLYYLKNYLKKHGIQLV